MINRIRFNKSNFYEMQFQFSSNYGLVITEAIMIALVKDLSQKIININYSDLKAKEEVLELLNKVIKVIETDSEEEVDKEVIKSFLDIIEKLHECNFRNDDEKKIFKIGIELLKKKIDEYEVNK